MVLAALTQTSLIVAAPQEASTIPDTLVGAGPETPPPPTSSRRRSTSYRLLAINDYTSSARLRKEAELLAVAQADPRWSDLQHGPVKGTEDYRSDEITNNILNGPIKGTKEIC